MASFGQILALCKFLAFIFPKEACRSLVLFGSPVVRTFVQKFVRTFVPLFRSYSLDRSIFFSDFCMKLGLHTTSMTSKKKLGQKIFSTPQGGFCTQKNPFLAEKWTFEPISSKRRAIIFSNFWYGNYPYGFL